MYTEARLFAVISLEFLFFYDSKCFFCFLVLEFIFRHFLLHKKRNVWELIVCRNTLLQIIYCSCDISLNKRDGSSKTCIFLSKTHTHRVFLQSHTLLPHTHVMFLQTRTMFIWTQSMFIWSQMMFAGTEPTWCLFEHVWCLFQHMQY